MDLNQLEGRIDIATMLRNYQSTSSYENPTEISTAGKMRTNNKKTQLRSTLSPLGEFMAEIREKRLLTAVSTNNVDQVLHLLTNGVSPNCCDTQKRSPLHIATTRNYKDIVKMLLVHGANPNQLDSIGNTPLHLASCTRHLEIVTLLIKHGASTLVTDRNGLHPLAIAYSKLKHCEKFRPKLMNNDELSTYHETIVNIYNLILHHFDIQKSEAEYNDFKNMEEKFKGLNTKEDLDKEVLSLLESLEKFTVSKS